MYVRSVGVIYAEQRLLQTSAEGEALDELESNVFMIYVGICRVGLIQFWLILEDLLVCSYRQLKLLINRN